MAEIDTLEVKIKANAQSAADALNRLATSLKNVKTALAGTKKDGITVTQKLSKSIGDLNNALRGIDGSGLKNLNRLSTELFRFANATARVKGVSRGSSITSAVKEAQRAIGAANGSKGSNSMVVKDRMEDVSGGSAVVNMKRVSRAWYEIDQELGRVRKKLGTVTFGFGKLFKAINRIAFYRAIRSALKAIGEAFSEGLKNAYGYSQQSETFKRLADTLDRAASKTAQMKNQLGALYGEFKQFIQPALEWLIEKVRSIGERLTELFAALNGEKTYLQAQLVATTWGDATDAVKKYKQQLLGLDELNNLTTQTSGKSDETDYSTLYKEVSVNDKLLKVGEQWGALKEKIKGSIAEIELFVGGALVGLGAVLTFSGANIPLGLAMLAGGTYIGLKAITENWDALNGSVSDSLASIGLILGGAAFGVGAVLAFSGANVGLGIGMMVGGASVAGYSAEKLNWNKTNKKVKEKTTRLIAILSGAELAIGAVLAFSGVSLKLGIPLMAAGAVGLATAATLNWDSISSEIHGAFQKFAPFFAPTGIGSMAVGALLLFTGHIGLGLGLLVGGGFLTATTISFNWDGILTGLQNAWIKIRQWWNSNVKGTINKAVNWLEKTLGWDVNGDGKIAGLQEDFTSTLESSSSGKLHGGTSYKFGDTTEGQTRTKNITGTGKNVYVSGPSEYTTKHYLPGYEPSEITVNVNIPFGGGNKVSNTVARLNAMGGINKPGSLFYAGEAGPEFIGSMGNTSAVANTGQMTDAIYKAAYMGMSRALQENGGGMSGFEPATMDDLFIAMKKKSSAYTKRTGQSAFA